MSHDCAEIEREIRRLTSDNARMREALLPFAKAIDKRPFNRWGRSEDARFLLMEAAGASDCDFTLSDLRKARAALSPEQKE